MEQMAVVTGGAQGIGRAVADKLTRNGVRVAVWDLDTDLAEKAATELGNGAFACHVDVSNWQSVEAAAERTISLGGPVSILVNSAGIAGSNAPLVDYPVDEFKAITEINLLGTFHVNRAIVPSMISAKYGRIVNIASVAGKEGNPNASAYSASKAGVIGLTKSLGKELAHMDIAVNCVTPAAARTRIFDQMKQEHIDYMLSKIPRGRFLELEEAASMIVWLCSPENSFTTGSVFDLSGGRATY
ncbi:SDR family NAD(P)-dependent oxidoreductase [Shimia biformata]|uniref:SDR family NAD(P)-dependent oxidoreductase n=1 Tax=Shimia biformata TaxID=1294299 RepID=UPI001EF28D0A|nr:SDR family NAD(P)-dependent oxidoreductase [Shimia biformata]